MIHPNMKPPSSFDKTKQKMIQPQHFSLLFNPLLCLIQFSIERTNETHYGRWRDFSVYELNTNFSQGSKS